MVIVTVCYLALVYLLFFKFKLLPWNGLTEGLTALVGTIILTGFLVGLQGLMPSSSQGIVIARIVEVAPQVSGRITSVNVLPNVVVKEGSMLFTIDPIPLEARVQELEARLKLSNLRLGQYQELAAVGAGSEFQLEQIQAEVEQLEASLKGARFDLANTVARAPAKGMVPRLFLKSGMQVSPSKSVLAFTDTDKLFVGGLFQQMAIQNVKIGDVAMVNFPALPSEVFETKVLAVPNAIGEGQWLASGQLPGV